MTQPNDSILVTPGSGATVATHLVAGKEYQVVMIADESGHFQQSLPTYTLWIPPVVVGANKLHWDIFNVAASGKIIELRGIWAIPKQDVAVVGVLGVEYSFYRTSAVGTGGTAAVYNSGAVMTAPVITPADTVTDPALNLATEVNARSAPTGGATISAPWWAQYIMTEEGSTAQVASTSLAAFMNLLPMGTMNKRLTLNPGQGILAKQGSVVGVGSIAALIQFTVV